MLMVQNIFKALILMGAFLLHKEGEIWHSKNKKAENKQ